MRYLSIVVTEIQFDVILKNYVISSKVRLSSYFLLMNLDKSHQRSTFISLSLGWTQTIYFSSAHREGESVAWISVIHSAHYQDNFIYIQSGSLSVSLFSLVLFSGKKKKGKQEVTVLCIETPHVFDDSQLAICLQA